MVASWSTWPLGIVKIVRPLLVIVALALSALPVLWMTVLASTQYGNLWLEPPHWREFPCIVAFWIGFAAAIVFARRCFIGRSAFAGSAGLLVLIGVGVVGGISEEIMLLNNAKTPFPIGYFELATL